jgi:beta-glucosidase
MSDLDRMVGRVLALKVRLGLLDGTRTDEPGTFSPPAPSRSIGEVAYVAAVESAVLLQNRNQILPISPNDVRDIAIIGPLADAPYEQMGTWVFDGDETLSQTPLVALQARTGTHLTLHYARGLAHSRSRDTSGFAEAVEAAKRSDIVLLFLGEESILSGEAHSRAHIALPGSQAELIKAIKTAGRPMIAVIMAGRPLTIGGLLDDLDAVFFAAHSGTMAGPALIDLIFGAASPVGRLPVSFPKSVGQIPVHYNHKNTGRPPQEDTSILIDDIEEGARQTSLGMTAYHLDDGYRPLFPFGFGLSYGTVEYGATTLSSHEMNPTEALTVSVTITNPSAYDIIETVQLYVRDCVASLTRPVKELKGFQRVHLAAGATSNVAFELKADDLAFHTRSGEWRPEPGRFLVGIGRDSSVALEAEFTLIAG